MTVENLEINVSKVGDAAAKSLGKLSKNVDGLKESASKSTGALGKLAASIKRIAFYRLLRTALKEVTKAFSEGLKNAYQFSKVVGYDLATTMDTIATKSMTMKNQMGAAFGGLIQAIEPILLRIISLVTQAENAIAALFGAFTTGQYLKAKDVATAWDDAAGAAGAYKRTILGFDEINRLDSPSGGGGGAANNFADMFDIMEAPAWAKGIADWFKEIGDKIPTEKIEALRDSAKKLWDLLSKPVESPLLNAILTFIQDMIALGAAAVIDTLTTAINLLNDAISITDALLKGDWAGALKILIKGIDLDLDGKITQDEVMKSVESLLNKKLQFAGGIVGFSLGGVGGALLGWTIGTAMTMYIESWKTRMDNIDQDAIYPFLSDNWIAQKISKAKKSLDSGVNKIVKPLFTKSFWQSSLDEFAEVLDALFVQPLENAQEQFPLIIDDIGNLLRKFFTVTIPDFFDKCTLKFWQFVQSIESGINNSIISPLNTVIDLINRVAGTNLSNIGYLNTAAKKATEVSATIAANNGNGNAARWLTANAGKYASGGFPSRGDLFIAGEAGAEIVSSHGGQTQVSNTDQIAYSVQAGNGVVVDAIYAMANAIVSSVERKDTNPVVTIGDRDVYRAWERGSSAVGGSLVHG